MYDKYSKFNNILKKYNQEHIIKYLNDRNREELINQVLDIDFEEVLELYNQTKENNQIDVSGIEPVTAINPKKMTEKEINEYRSIGENTIKSGEFAISIMAGGQGTRLRT